MMAAAVVQEPGDRDVSMYNFVEQSPESQQIDIKTNS